MTMLIQWAVTSSILILAVVLVRALLGKRMGAGLRYALWGLVLLRLLVPVQLFSVPVPQPVREALEHHQTQTADPAPVYPPAGDEDPGVVVLTPATQAPGAVPEDVPPAIPDTPAAPVAPERPFGWQGVFGWLWLGGGITMGLALTVCNVRFALDLRRRRRPVETDCALPVYAVEGLESPCLFGVVRPAVYVTPETAADPVMLRHVLAHETTHARHGDQAWSLLRCAALAIHWWNPLVWLAAFLSRRDGELACDEGAIKLLGDNERRAYGWTLLTLVTAQPSPVSLMSAATTMSGGKKALWERVRCIAHAQKKAIWAAALAIVLAVAVTACAFSSAAAPEEEPGESPDPVTSESPEPAGSEEPDPLQTDLNRNGIPETLEVVEITDGKQLRVMENGYCVWSEDGFYAHGGWNTLFLCRFDGQDWLLRYNPYMSTGSANHSYTLFSLTDGWQQVKDGAVTGEVMVKQIGGMRFDTNFGQSMHEPMDTESVTGFLEELSPLLEDVQPLLNTNPELEDLHERTGRWLTYPWDQYAPERFAYDESKSMEDNLQAWEDAGDPLCTLPVPPNPSETSMPFTGSLNLEFCSGAGAWRTRLTLNADGTFTGQFNDSDMGVPEEGYHTTQYLCIFHGRFGAVEQVSEHVWALTLEEITLDTGHPVGEEWIVDGTRYISSTPYGLESEADDVPQPGTVYRLYMPGATPEETGADEEFYWWLHMGPQMDFNCWALHNPAYDYGFLAR